jgi:hypothetical protein
MCCRRLALTRLAPFSYFWTCWNVSPRAVREIGLAHIEHEPPHSQTAADVLVGGIENAVERTIQVGYKKLYILVERRRYDQAPINILANMGHGRISTTSSGVEARPHFETRTTQRQ